MKVRELMSEATKQWDRNKLAYWFEGHTIADSLRIPVTNLHANDVLEWKENKSRTFSVKSTYGVALRLLNPPKGEYSLAAANERLWKSVWS